MMPLTHSVTADFDGTLFDPNLRAFIAWYYNSKTRELLNNLKIPFVLNTGRPIWDPFSDIQLGIVGMKKPNVVIYGAGTKILWRKNNHYELDRDWEDIMQKTKWDKEKTIKSIIPVIKKYSAKFYDTKNEYMTRVWVDKMPVSTLSAFITSLQKQVENTKILRTEQILLQNTEEIFSGYLLLIPSIAGKEEGMKHVIKKLSSKINLVFGDALVDLPMLLDKSIKAFALNPTALARKGLKNTNVTILEGSPPENLLKTLMTELSIKQPIRNSPYRSLTRPILSLLEPFIYPNLTPDELSLKGLELVRNAINKPYHLRGGMGSLIAGYMMDVFDGLRSRRLPKVLAPRSLGEVGIMDNGQLIDGYADRMKEYLLLTSRREYDTAISCFLPSIARAQVESLGNTIPEFDPFGGSALSRSIKLIKSYFLLSIGNVVGSKRVDASIFLSNMKTFESRRKQAKTFSWTKLKDYDRTATKRLVFYVSLLQKQLSKQKIADAKLKEALKEYEKVNTKQLQKDLKLSFPRF